MKKLAHDLVVPIISASDLTDLVDYSLGHDFLAEMKQAPNPG